MEFPYEKGKGILSYLFKKYNGNIEKYINYSQSFNYYQEQSTRYLFDDSSETYWIQEGDAPYENYIYFCFLDYYVKITYFEIYCPNISVDYSWPSKWGFSGTNYIEKWNENENIISDEMYPSYYSSKSYSRGTFQCFSFISHGNEKDEAKNKYRTRISKIDIFGTLIPIHCNTIITKQHIIYPFCNVFLLCYKN